MIVCAKLPVRTVLSVACGVSQVLAYQRWNMVMNFIDQSGLSRLGMVTERQRSQHLAGDKEESAVDLDYTACLYKTIETVVMIPFHYPVPASGTLKWRRSSPYSLLCRAVFDGRYSVVVTV